ncbi:MAG: peptide deformylase [Myxococcales bacterium]|nr:peptide deformylase [Myxococcales bacterium]MCB9549407.1 peptide deformylase [Myxococcales bacterium]
MVLEVLPWPNPYLRKRADEVEAFDDELRAFVADMEETMHDRDGLGLAATQVGRNMRLLILDPYAFEGDEGRGKPNVVVINPEVVWQSEETITGEEGCLSFPGVFIQVERPHRVRIRARDAQGEAFEIEGEGLGARAILHEIDHLNGVVMIDHVGHLSRQRALKKHQKNQKVKLAAEREEAGRKVVGRKRR